VVVVVKAGDSLWVIAEEHLPAGASKALVDATWHRWYQANRGVIGGNPDLILPGQHLHAPESKAS
jgi:nucleoid-associated protein YgaU